jgi:hypothetical protein
MTGARGHRGTKAQGTGAPLTEIVTVAVLALAFAPTVRAQEAAKRSVSDQIWIAFGLGGGQLEHWSDQLPAARKTTVTGSFRFGAIVSPALRVGLETNGWGLQSSSLSDPSRGETVNETLLIAQVYPWPKLGLYLKGGCGWGSYHNNGPAEWGSSAFGAFAVGAGYELRLWKSVAITLAADWAQGPLGSVDNLVTTSTGRSFRGWDLILGAQWH